MKKSGLLIWAFLRLPILAGGLYLFRFQIIAIIEEQFGLGSDAIFAVYSASTFSTRLLLYFVCVPVLVCGYGLLNKWMGAGPAAYLLSLAGAFIAIYISFAYLLLTPDTFWRTLPVAYVSTVRNLFRVEYVP